MFQTERTGAETHRIRKTVYGNEAVSDMHVYSWLKNSLGCEDLGMNK